VAKEFGMRIKMAAKVDAVDADYFEKEIKPHIDGNHVEFIGEVGSKEKNEFLRNAYALLAPIQWREPFGLFLVEAMATGTPVVVTNMGAAPELVGHGETGFVVGNAPSEFVSALRDIPSISRHACRKRVEQYFSMDAMAQGYLNVYNKIIDQTRNA
jgi:glycosyltransferase involved in cell wall biosynthesis